MADDKRLYVAELLRDGQSHARRRFVAPYCDWTTNPNGAWRAMRYEAVRAARQVGRIIPLDADGNLLDAEAE